MAVKKKKSVSKSRASKSKAPKKHVVKKSKPAAKSRPISKGGKKKRKDKFSFNYEDMKNSVEWKSDWDDDAGDFEGESTEY